MKEYKTLPVVMPPLTTYHYNACPGVVAMNHPKAYTWYYNNAVDITVQKKFLNGYTSPMIAVPGNTYENMTFIRCEKVNLIFTMDYLKEIIRRMIDQDFYVYFTSADDYYLPGKSWYKERHFRHDGMVSGYDMRDDSFTLTAYDSRWIFRSFRVPADSLVQAFESAFRISFPNGNLLAWKHKRIPILPDPGKIRTDIASYLDSDLRKYPFSGEGTTVHGMVVYPYLVEYLTRLGDGRIPHERMDRRVFRLFYEHKALMRGRLAAFSAPNADFAKKYEAVVGLADRMRFQYKKYELKPVPYDLELLIEYLEKCRELESEVLEEYLENTEKEGNTEWQAYGKPYGKI